MPCAAAVAKVYFVIDCEIDFLVASAFWVVDISVENSFWVVNVSMLSVFWVV
jgi:hypothetical protein